MEIAEMKSRATDHSKQTSTIYPKNLERDSL